MQAEDPPAIGQTVLVTGSRADADQADLGLELLWLPLESRSSIPDYVGRNLPGAALDGDGRLLLRGGRAEDTAYELDGLRTRRLAVPMSMLQRLDVATAGYGAEWSDVLGGVVGATTRSGSNRFHADVDVAAELRDPTTVVLAPALSGPIWRDRLFFLMAYQRQARQTPGRQDEEGILPETPSRDSWSQGGGLKLTLVPHANHRVESLTLVDWSRTDNHGGLGIEREAQPTYEQLELATSLRWTGRWDRVAASSQVGLQRLRDEEMPLRCRSEPELCDTVPSVVQRFPRTIRSDNWPRHEIARETEWQAVNGLEATLVERPRIRQRLRASSRLTFKQLSWSSRTPGDKVLSFNGPGVRESEQTTFANDPRSADPEFGWFRWTGSSLATVHSLESETHLGGRLLIVPGVALAVDRASADVYTGVASALTPHLTLAWDLRGDGRTWLRASSHQRTGAGLESVVRFVRRTAFTRTCSWDPDTGLYSRNCSTRDGGQKTIGRPCGPDGISVDGNPCLEELRLPRAWEHVASVDHEPGRGVRLSMEVVYRRPTDLARTHDTNQIWNASGNTTTGFRNGRAESVYDYTTDLDGQRYLDVTFAVRKQTGHLRVLGAYTFSRYRSAVYDSLIGAAFGSHLVSADDDRPHSFRGLLSYDFDGYGSFGVAYSNESGSPVRRWARPAVSAGEYRGGVGAPPGTNLNDPGDDRGPVPRTRSVRRLNLQLRLRTKRLIGPDFHLYGDVINLLNRHEEAIVDPDASITLRAAEPGRWIRVGLEYRY